jgi:hypothetical protein
MDLLLELWRDTAIQDGFEQGLTLSDIANETGLSVREVIKREIDLQLMPAAQAQHLLRSLSRKPPR